MLMESVKKKEVAVKVVLALILVVTFISAVKQSAPFDSVDEVGMMYWIRNLDQDPLPVLIYPPLFLYLHYILSWVYGVVLTLLGMIGDSSFFLSSDIGFRFTMEAGRIVNALLATLLVYVVYRTGREFFNRLTGLAAALLVSVNYLVILYAHIFRPDILVTLLMTITLYFLLKYHHTAKPMYILFASLFSGLSTAAKFNAFPLILVIVSAILLTVKKDPITGEKQPRPLKTLFLFLPPAAAAGFFLGAPNWLIHPIGNIKESLELYSPDAGILLQQFGPKSFLEIPGAFLQDLITHFGLIFFIIFAAGILMAFLSGNKRDILVTCFIVIYIVVLSFFGYYAGRFGLPVYPAAALLAGKFLFVDIKKIFRRFGLLPRFAGAFKYAAVLLWIFIGAHALDQIIVNVKTFNLMKTQSRWDRILEYRQQHHIDDQKYHVARQIYTPPFHRGDTKLTKRFHLKFPKRDRKKTLYFVQAHLPTYKRFRAGKEAKGKKGPGTINLKRHKPFYQVRKRSYQPWDPESVFLYRIPGALKGIGPGKEGVRLPRPFYRGQHTSFLPLQVYEQNPNFGKLVKKTETNTYTYEHWLYSREKIKKITVWLFSLKRHGDVTIRVNNRTVDVKTRLRPPVERIDIEAPRPLPFYYDYVYRVRLHSMQRGLKQKPYYFVLEPVFADENKHHKTFILAKPARGPIPHVFSNKPFPLWIKIFYKTTGIDLSLLSYVNTHQLYTNTAKTVSDVSLDYIALEKGDYLLRLEGEKLVDTHPMGTTAFLEYTYYGLTGAQRKQAPIVPLIPLTGSTGKLPTIIPLEIKDRVGFVTFNLKGLRQNNLLIKRVSITPDYRQFVDKHLVRKSK
jgi:hypothetical protein